MDYFSRFAMLRTGVVLIPKLLRAASASGEAMVATTAPAVGTCLWVNSGALSRSRLHSAAWNTSTASVDGARRPFVHAAGWAAAESPFSHGGQRRGVRKSAAAQKQDYYQLLGVGKKASQDEIKKAYRVKARELHPDVNKSPDASKQFAEVSAAYDVLSDPEKRVQYDQFGEEAFQGGGGPQDWQGVDPEEILRHFGFSGGRGGGGGGGKGGFNFQDIFGGGGPSQDPTQAAQGDHIQLSMSLSFEEAVRGVEKEVSFNSRVQCDSCRGSGLAKGASRKTCRSCKGSGHNVRSSGFFQMMEPCRKCQGTGTTIEDPCGKCAGEGHTRERTVVKVSVPEGADNGLNLRVAHKGHAGVNGGPAGHLFIELRVASDDLFERQGPDIHLSVPLTVSQAILGGKVRVPTLRGEVEVVVPAGCQPGESRLLRGKGVKRINGDAYGNQHLHFKIVIPKTITPTQRQHLEKFAEEDLIQPSSSWISKLKKWAASFTSSS
ncbi:MAG: J domain-containing protein [archaeon]|nr:J domain-containing protein [archaeon]